MTSDTDGTAPRAAADEQAGGSGPVAASVPAGDIAAGDIAAGDSPAGDASAGDVPAGDAPGQPQPDRAGPPPQPRSAVARAWAERAGRTAVTAVRAIGGGIAAAGRLGARAATWIWAVLDAVPPAVRGFGFAAVGMLLGVVGAIAVGNTFGLVCTVVVIPVCASILGALGHRWYSGTGRPVQPGRQSESADPSSSELRRSVVYVDNKLALALTSLGTDRHQQAVVALFQAKTAVELTLGTEQDSHSYDVALRSDDYGLTPRVRTAPNPTTELRETNSLAAS